MVAEGPTSHRTMEYERQVQQHCVLVIFMGLPRPPLIVLLHAALMLRKVLLLRPLFNNVPGATFRMHLFDFVL